MDDHCVPPDLATRAAISDVIVEYATAVDTRDWTSFRQLFTDDAVIDYSAAYGPAGGPDEITRWISGLMTRDLVPDAMHAITNKSRIRLPWSNRSLSRPKTGLPIVPAAVTSVKNSPATTGPYPKVIWAKRAM